MQAITTIGLDIAKSVFQVHGVDAEGHLVIRRQLKRRQVVYRHNRRVFACGRRY
jgi:transposase